MAEAVSVLFLEYNGRRLITTYHSRMADQMAQIRADFGLPEASIVTLKVQYENQVVEVLPNLWPRIRDIGINDAHLFISNALPAPARPQNAGLAAAALAALGREQPNPGANIPPAVALNRGVLDRGRPPAATGVPFPMADRQTNRPVQRPGISTGMATENTVNRPGPANSRGDAPSTRRKQSERSKSRRRREEDPDYPMTPRSMYESEPEVNTSRRRTRSNADGNSKPPLRISFKPCQECKLHKVQCRFRPKFSLRPDYSPVRCERCKDEDVECSEADYFGSFQIKG